MSELQNSTNLEELSEETQPGFVGEFIDFLKYNKKWWLLPIVLVLAMVGGLAMLSSTGAAPFIYTLF